MALRALGMSLTPLRRGNRRTSSTAPKRTTNRIVNYWGSMTTTHTNRTRRAGLRQLAGAPLALGLVLPMCAVGQVSSYADKAEGPNAANQLPTVLHGATIQQHLNAQLPLGAGFTDDHGNPVTLGQYFDGKHPVLLSAVYYNCPMLCSEELDGITSALEMVHLTPGKDFQVVVISIDPTETPQLAARRK